MDGLLIGLAIVGGLLLIFFIWYISTSNEFNRMLVKIDEADSGIDVALTKRFDLLTKMFKATKGYAEHERQTLEKIVAMRQPSHEAPIQEKQEFANKVSEGLRQMNVIVENYPDLKANTTFIKLMDGVSEVEEHLQAARRLYNSNVSHYNQKLVTFPSSLVGGWKKLTKRAFFEAEAQKRADVDFNF